MSETPLQERLRATGVEFRAQMPHLAEMLQYPYPALVRDFLAQCQKLFLLCEEDYLEAADTIDSRDAEIVRLTRLNHQLDALISLYEAELDTLRAKVDEQSDEIFALKERLGE